MSATFTVAMLMVGPTFDDGRAVISSLQNVPIRPFMFALCAIDEAQSQSTLKHR